MKITYNSPVILSFALMCTAIYFLDRFTGLNIMQYFLVQDRIVWTNPFSIFTLCSHVIGHGSIEHLLGNLTFILLLGPIVEEKYGSLRTLVMILVTALVTGILNVMFFSTGLYGASGIVFMLILLVSFTNSKDNSIPLTFILVAILFLGKEIMQSLSSDHISQFAHIIGGVCGSVFGYIWKPKRLSGGEGRNIL